MGRLIMMLGLALSICNSTQGSSGPFVVERMTAAAGFSPRDGARLEYFNGKYWLLGGWQPVTNAWSATNAVTNEVWSSPDLVTWTRELTHVDSPPTVGAGARWHPRHTHMTCVFDGKLWVMGSDQYDPGGSAPNPSNDPISSDVWSSVDGVTWVQVAADSLSSWGHDRGTWDAIIGVYGGYMHIIGGFRAGGPTDNRTAWPTSSEHWRSQDGVTWEQLDDVPFTRARTLRAVEVGGRLVVVGGLSSPPPFHLNPAVAMRDVWTWDGSTWTQTSDGSSTSWQARTWVGVAAYDNKLWALTGWGDATLRNLGGIRWSSNFGATWNELPTGTVGLPLSHADGVIGTEAGIAVAGGFAEQSNVWLLSVGEPDDVEYPGTLPLTAWLRSDYSAGSWLGSYSAASAGANHFIEATGANQPSVGASLNGYPTVDFDGTNDKLTGPSVFPSSALILASFSIWWLFNADSAVADPGAAAPYNAPGIDDTSGAGLAIGYCAAGVRAGYYDGSTWNSVAQAASTGSWHLARIRSDGTKIELSVDSNAFTSVARGTLNGAGVTAFPLRIGTAYNGSFFNGRMAEIGMAKEALSDEVFDNIKSYINSKYGLSL